MKVVLESKSGQTTLFGREGVRDEKTATISALEGELYLGRDRPEKKTRESGGRLSSRKSCGYRHQKTPTNSLRKETSRADEP